MNAYLCIPATTSSAEDMGSSINSSMMISSTVQSTKSSSSSLLEDFNSLSITWFPFHFEDNQISYVQAFHHSNIWYLSACSHANHWWNPPCFDSCFPQFLNSLDTWVSQICALIYHFCNMFSWIKHWILQPKIYCWNTPT